MCVALWFFEIDSFSKLVQIDPFWHFIFIDFYFHENEPKARLKLDRTLQTNKQFDYFIVIEKRSHTETKKQYANWDLIPIHYSENARGDKAVIYKVLNIDN